MLQRLTLSLVALASLATSLAVDVPASHAATANGPICDTAAKVNSTTYYSCRGSTHTALDIANGTCSVWNHRGMLVGSYRYTLYSGCANSCGACNAGAGCCNATSRSRARNVPCTMPSWRPFNATGAAATRWRTSAALNSLMAAS